MYKRVLALKILKSRLVIALLNWPENHTLIAGPTRSLAFSGMLFTVTKWIGEKDIVKDQMLKSKSQPQYSGNRRKHSSPQDAIEKIKVEV
jgi:hypothetical protein